MQPRTSRPKPVNLYQIGQSFPNLPNFCQPARTHPRCQIGRSADVHLRDGEVREEVPELVGVLTSLRGLLEQAADLGRMAEGDAQDRALTLVFALNGVLQLQKLQRFRPDIDPARLARAAGRDLLMGWGVDPSGLDARSLAAVRLARRAMEEVR